MTDPTVAGPGGSPPDVTAGGTPAPVTTASGTPAADPLPPRPHRNIWSRRTPWRRASLVVAVLAWSATVLMLLLAVGMFRNDMVIDAAPVRATATVLTVSALSTGVEFVDNAGVAQRPPAGVLYPGGLRVGQQFVVEYAADDPTLARVAGRSAVNGLVMPLGVTAVTWVVATPGLWGLGLRGARADRRSGPDGRRRTRLRRARLPRVRGAGSPR